MTYYPAFLNLKNKQVFLFGGGQVALRKARVLIQSGAHLIAISRDFSGAFIRFAKQNEIKMQFGNSLPKKFRAVSLVIAATSDSAFNQKIYERCRRQNIFVNVVDDPAHSTFIVPSLLKRGSLQIAISTGGASPLLAKTLRKKLARQFGAAYGQLVQRLGRDRKKSKRLFKSEIGRRNHFQKLVASELMVLEKR